MRVCPKEDHKRAPDPTVTIKTRVSVVFLSVDGAQSLGSSAKDSLLSKYRRAKISAARQDHSD